MTRTKDEGEVLFMGNRISNNKYVLMTVGGAVKYS